MIQPRLSARARYSVSGETVAPAPLTLESFLKGLPDWMFDPRRNCAGHETEEFFGDDSATQICNRSYGSERKTCPFKQECLQWALDHNEFGVWGGTSERGRRRIRRQRRQGAA